MVKNAKKFDSVFLNGIIFLVRLGKNMKGSFATERKKFSFAKKNKP